ADDDPRLRDPVEQLRLRVPVVRLARAAARRAEGRGPRAIRLAAPPPLRERRVRPEPRADARREREPRVCGGLPGLPRDRLRREKQQHAAFARSFRKTCADSRWLPWFVSDAEKPHGARS